MNFKEFQWFGMQMLPKQRKYKHSTVKPLKFLWNLWNSLKFFEIHWNSLKFLYFLKFLHLRSLILQRLSIRMLFNWRLQYQFLSQAISITCQWKQFTDKCEIPSRSITSQKARNNQMVPNRGPLIYIYTYSWFDWCISLYICIWLHICI